MRSRSRTRIARRLADGSAGTSSGKNFITWSSRLSFPSAIARPTRSEEHTSELQSQSNLVCRLLLEKKKLGPPETRAPAQWLQHLGGTGLHEGPPGVRTRVVRPPVFLPPPIGSRAFLSAVASPTPLC